MHRRAPGTDYRALEVKNGVAQVERRADAARLRVADGRWVERGSEDQSGSMFAVVPASGGGVYAGSALGGLWYGDGEGGGWEPLGDATYGGANEVVALPDGAGGDVTIVTGTGGLVWRSVDRGASWARPAGLESAHPAARRMVRDTEGRVFLLMGDYWTGSMQLFRSEDRGGRFTRVDELGGLGDLWAPREGEARLYVVSDTLRVSEDGGRTWTPRGAIPDGASHRLVGSEAGALWLAVTDGQGQSGLFRSADDGQTWRPVGMMPDFWGAFTASRIRDDLVAWGGLEAWVLEGVDAAVRRVNSWDEYYIDPDRKLHADIMAITTTREGEGERWWLGTHGGVYRSDDGLQSVRNLSRSGLRVSQYYDTLTSTANPAHVVAGSQDQGWQQTESAAWDSDERFHLDQIMSGDFGQLTSGDGTHAWVIGTYPGATLITRGEVNPELTFLEFPRDGAISPWMPAVIADPDDPGSFFFLTNHVWYYERKEGSWRERVWSDQDFQEATGEYLSQMVLSPVDPQRTYAVTSLGRIFVSSDKAVTWELGEVDAPAPMWLYGAAVWASRQDVDTAYVGGSGYDNPAVLRTTDGGQTWEPWGQGLPPTLVYALCEAPDGSGAMFAGTETSAYMRAADGEAWVDITSGRAPITTYWSCEPLHHEATVRFGTYGRGIWDYRLAAQGEGCFPALDADGDAVPCPTDCDDTRPEVVARAPEICGDGVDQDCDGVDVWCKKTEEDERGCGCAASGTGGAWLGPVLLLLAGRRRRSGQLALGGTR
jgi:MYXO-CTERM domain-containing protein